MVATVDDCTHLVINSFARTVKMLMAIVRTRHIVTPQWLQASLKARKFLGTLPLDSALNGVSHRDCRSYRRK